MFANAKKVHRINVEWEMGVAWEVAMLQSGWKLVMVDPKMQLTAHVGSAWSCSIIAVRLIKLSGSWRQAIVKLL